jgi:hypothetical protein
VPGRRTRRGDSEESSGLYGNRDLPETNDPMNRTRSRQNVRIRETMVGGDDLLDALPLVHRLASRLAERGLAGQTEADEAYAALDRLRSLMVELSKDKRPPRD